MLLDKSYFDEAKQTRTTGKAKQTRTTGKAKLYIRRYLVKIENPFTLDVSAV